MAKPKRKKKPATNPVERFLRPTEEREAHNDFQSAGAAMRVIPPIVLLHNQGVLNDDEYTALAYYRDQASLADKSLVRSGCDFEVRTPGNGPGAAITSARLEVGRMERDAGPYLASLIRSVARDDMTLEAWAIAEWGSVPGSNPPEAKPEKVGMAALELKFAAGGITPRLD